ncbi:MAG: TonB-dependent receptor [Sinimarinibacterium flocculans]|uniref:TonB-dependent receptor n=1 Tax=Sinimarinibacterium flocculans TaxID=985250 RepID=UPI003C352698
MDLASGSGRDGTCGLIALLAFAAAMMLFCTAVTADDEITRLAPQTVSASRTGPSLLLDDERYPANLQVWSDPLDMRDRGFADTLERQAAGVFISDAAGNSSQADLFYRGYTASPLLGLPQGLALYQDGVRINAPFGDIVQWDLVPMAAIRRLELVPGPSPLYGQNALGGAIAATTYTGWDQNGSVAQLIHGSDGRYGAAVTHGMSSRRHALFVAIEAENDEGWRDHSRSRMRRGFARLSWAEDDAALDLRLTAADNRLLGNGAAPEQLLDNEGRDAVFTYPDRTSPQLLGVHLSGSRLLAPTARLRGGVYLRSSLLRTLNGDGTEYEACEEPDNSDAAGRPWLCADDDDTERVVRDDDDRPVLAGPDNLSATLNTSRTQQRAYGAHLRADFAQQLGGRPLRWHAGVSYDGANVEFSSATELARLTAGRSAAGSGVEDAGARIGVDTQTQHAAAFASAGWDIAQALTLTAAARFEHIHIRLDDRIGEALNGNHRFRRLNPMLALSWTAAPGHVVFVSLAQASRAPTPVELTCADPDDPCRLPNSFVSDPPLDQVLARSIEIGLRGARRHAAWRVAAFHSRAARDILFIADGDVTNEGYFANVGDTLRRGIEFGFKQTLVRGLGVSLDYAFVDARFRDGFTVNTPHHPVRDGGAPVAAARRVSGGDRLPLVPRHLLRAALDWNHGAWQTGVEVLARSSAPYRGDEANVDPRRLPGYAIAHLRLQWQASARLSLIVGVDNLFDTDYETFGVYGEADEVLGEDYEDARRFVGPGAPRSWSLGLRLDLRR